MTTTFAWCWPSIEQMVVYTWCFLRLGDCYFIFGTMACNVDLILNHGWVNVSRFQGMPSAAPLLEEQIASSSSSLIAILTSERWHIFGSPLLLTAKIWGCIIARSRYFSSDQWLHILKYLCNIIFLQYTHIFHCWHIIPRSYFLIQ